MQTTGSRGDALLMWHECAVCRGRRLRPQHGTDTRDRPPEHIRSEAGAASFTRIRSMLGVLAGRCPAHCRGGTRPRSVPLGGRGGGVLDLNGRSAVHYRVRDDESEVIDGPLGNEHRGGGRCRLGANPWHGHGIHLPEPTRVPGHRDADR